MILSLFLLQAAIASPMSDRSECPELTARAIAAAPAENGRVVITFTGSQSSLLPLDQQAAAFAEPTLFPIHTREFVLTLQVKPNKTVLDNAAAITARVCQLGTSSGGRFEGAMAFVRETKSENGRILTRERMIEAAMARLPTK